MKRIGKLKFFIVFSLIIIFAAMNIFGISTQWGDVTTVYVKGLRDINWGLDIGGGAQAVFTPSPGTKNITESQMDEAEALIKERLAAERITDYEVYSDYKNNSIVVRFPWLSEQTSSDMQQIINNLGATAELKFIKGSDTDESTGLPTGETIMTRDDVKSAMAQYGYTSSDNTSAQYFVAIQLTDEGTAKFSEVTGEMAAAGGGTISIWLDGEMVAAPTFDNQIDDGSIAISGSDTNPMTQETAIELAEQINGGQMPFSLDIPSVTRISPALGTQAKFMLAVAGIAICLAAAAFMIWKYRLPGTVACIALAGQAAFSLAIISGFFPPFPNFTMTLAGVAGVAAGMIMGLDYSIKASLGIRDEIANGKSLEGSVKAGHKRAFGSVVHGNILLILAAVILMGAFGAPSGLFAKLFTPIFFLFDTITEGSMYSFGYTLGISIIGNFIMAVSASRLMLKALTTFECFQNPKYYGGAK